MKSPHTTQSAKVFYDTTNGRARENNNDNSKKTKIKNFVLNSSFSTFDACQTTQCENIPLWTTLRDIHTHTRNDNDNNKNQATKTNVEHSDGIAAQHVRHVRLELFAVPPCWTETPTCCALHCGWSDAAIRQRHSASLPVPYRAVRRVAATSGTAGKDAATLSSPVRTPRVV